jgi:twitching motility protein PilT
VSLVQSLLRALVRPDVSECALATGRFPAARSNDKWEALSEAAVSTDDIVSVLMSVGGARQIEDLGETPVKWAFRSRGVGSIACVASQRGNEIRARFVVTERDAPPKKQSLRPPKPKSVVPAKRKSMVPPKSVPPPSSSLERKQSELMLDRDADASLYAAPKKPTAHATGAFSELFSAARHASASDLHIIADRPVLMRIAGELVPRGEPLDPAFVEAMLMPLVPARLHETLARDGSCDFALTDDKGRARVNVARQRTGLKATFRLIPADIPTLAALGLPEEVANATKHHQGLILVTGPTGHGKTTTLTAIVDHINRESTHHVVTVEDPVEFVHPRKRAMMSQREVGTHTKSFGRALKGALREDPDVIVVGELRDVETVSMAVAASETGHLVVGTMNTPSAAKTIDRLIDMFPPGDQSQVRRTLAGGLKLVIGQRLVPSVDRKRVHAAVELLTGSVALWNLIREEKTFQIPSLQQRGRSLGIIRLDDSLAALVRAGKCSADVAAFFAESPETFNAAVKAKA